MNVQKEGKPLAPMTKMSSLDGILRIVDVISCSFIRVTTRHT